MKKKYPSTWKMLSKLFSRQSGFSLAEIMVAAGLLGIVSLGVMQVMQNISRGSKKLEQDQEKMNIRSTLTNIMRNKTNCDAALAGLTVNNAGTAVPNGRIKVSPTLADAFIELNKVFGQGTKGAQRVTELSIYGYKTGPGVGDHSTAPAAYNEYTFTDGSGALQTRRKGIIELRVVLTKGHANASAAGAERSSFGQLTSLIRLDLEVVATTANVIESCFGNSDEFTTAACNAMGGTLASDGTCRNIVIQNDTSLTPPADVAAQFNPNPNNYSLLVKGPVLLLGAGDDLTTLAPDDNTAEEGGVIVSVDQNTMGGGPEATTTNLMAGGGPSGANVANDREAGDLDVEGRVRIGFGGYGLGGGRTASQNASNRGELQVQRNTILQGNVSIGDIAVPAYSVGNVNTNGFLNVEANIESMGNIGVGKSAETFDPTGANNGYLYVLRDADIDRNLRVNNNAQIDRSLGVGKAADNGAAGFIDATNHIRTDQSFFADVDANITRNVNVNAGDINIDGTDGAGNLNIDSGNATLTNGDILVSSGHINMANTSNTTSYIRLRATPPYTGLTTEQTYRVPNIQWVRNYVVEEIAKTFTTNNTELNALRADILNVSNGNDGIDIIRNYTCDAIRIRDKDGTVFSESGTCSFPSNDTRCDSNGKCSNVFAGTKGATSGTLYGYRVCIGTSRNLCKTNWNTSVTVSGTCNDVNYQYNHSTVNPSNSTSGDNWYNHLCTSNRVAIGLRRRYYWSGSSGIHYWRSYVRCCALQ